MDNFKKFFRGVKEGQKFFGEVVSTLVNSLLLGIVYIIGVGLTSMASIIAGKKFLEKDLESTKETYWMDLNISTKGKEEYYTQY